MQVRMWLAIGYAEQWLGLTSHHARPRITRKASVRAAGGASRIRRRASQGQVRAAIWFNVEPSQECAASSQGQVRARGKCSNFKGLGRVRADFGA
jgi:hypothetical protein